MKFKCVSLNKVFLEHSHAYVFMYDMIVHDHSKVEQLQVRLYVLQSLKYLRSVSLQENACRPLIQVGFQISLPSDFVLAISLPIPLRTNPIHPALFCHYTNAKLSFNYAGKAYNLNSASEGSFPFLLLLLPPRVGRISGNQETQASILNMVQPQKGKLTGLIVSWLGEICVCIYKHHWEFFGPLNVANEVKLKKKVSLKAVRLYTARQLSVSIQFACLLKHSQKNY